MSRTPSFARGERVPAPMRRSELIAVAALGLLLLLLVFAVQRDALAAKAGWRPFVTTTCKLFGCDVPAWRQPTAFTMLAREVIAVPDRPGVLRVQASFRNDARWAQAWPALVLTLTDADNRILGTRRFLPEEYLGKPTQGETLAPGQATQLAFDIAEPAPNVVGYDFRFD